VIFRILLMQRERFFDDLYARTWNQSRRAACNVGGNIDSGITLESIGQIEFSTYFLVYEMI